MRSSRHVSLLLGLLVGVAGACSAVATPRTPPQTVGDSVAADGLLFRGTTQIWGAAPESIHVAVRVVNRRGAPARLRYGACVLDPRLLPDSALASGSAGERGERAAGRPAYVWSARPESSVVALPGRRRTVTFRACPMYLATTDLAPGDSLAATEFTWRERLDFARADSLRGAYRVVTRLELSGVRYDVPAGTVRLP